MFAGPIPIFLMKPPHVVVESSSLLATPIKKHGFGSVVLPTIHSFAGKNLDLLTSPKQKHRRFLGHGATNQNIKHHQVLTTLSLKIPSRFHVDHGSLNVPIEHHPTPLDSMIGIWSFLWLLFQVMSNTPKMGHLPTPDGINIINHHH